ncbi:MAG TPA: hypothetical protein VKO63_09405 [Chitinispirillaceae bacterium]|nr:hypothetical protein [Chitinispirillaceae bacterium]
MNTLIQILENGSHFASRSLLAALGCGNLIDVPIGESDIIGSLFHAFSSAVLET